MNRPISPQKKITQLKGGAGKVPGRISKVKQTSVPKATKGIRFHVPAPQRERIVRKFISGQSLRSISRDEGRGRATVARIVNCGEVREYVTGLRATYYGLGEDALQAVRSAIQTSTDGKIAYQLLADIGVVPGQEERQKLAAVVAGDDDEEARIQMYIGRLIGAGVHQMTAYKLPVDEQVEKVIARAGGTINRKTGTIEPLFTEGQAMKKKR
jgi:hypothetical protein